MNYQQIRKVALAYSDRAKDVEVNDTYDTFLLLVESRVNQRLSVREMSVRSRITVNDGQEYYGLPPDFNSLRDIEFYEEDSTASTTLEYVSPKQLNDYKGSGATGTRYYTLIADQLQVAMPPSSGGIEIIYFRNVPPLLPDTSPDSNWLSESAPDVYIFGLCTEIAAFTKNAEALAIWEKRFEKALDQLEYDDSMARWSGTSLKVRLG